MFENDFHPLITKPTRITGTSATAIDHIWSNAYGCKTNAGILVDCIADHLPVMQCSQIGTVKELSLNKEKRNFSDKNICIFLQELNKIDISGILEESETNKAYTMFIDVYSEAFRKCFPLKQINL